MRLTMSRDGKRRGTVHVPVRVDRSLLVAALCYELVVPANGSEQLPGADSYDPSTWPDRVGQEQILSMLRSIIRMEGTAGLETWGDGLVDFDTERLIEDWAAKVVDDAFPGFQ